MDDRTVIIVMIIIRTTVYRQSTIKTETSLQRLWTMIAFKSEDNAMAMQVGPWTVVHAIGCYWLLVICAEIVVRGPGFISFCPLSVCPLKLGSIYTVRILLNSILKTLFLVLSWLANVTSILPRTTVYGPYCLIPVNRSLIGLPITYI